MVDGHGNMRLTGGDLVVHTHDEDHDVDTYVRAT